jgi:osmoprotectant transport system substrate-binding protein
MFHRLRVLAALIAAVVLAGAGAAQAQLTVGGKNFTEQLLLAEMTTQYLDAHGFDVEKRDGMGSTVLRRAQRNGQVDVYWEYVGTSLIVYNKVEGGAKMSPAAAYEKVKELDAEKGLVWLNPTDANNTYALAMREEHASDLGIKTLSGLVDYVQNEEMLSLATDSEWAGRPDGLPGFQDHYEVRWPRDAVRRMQAGLIYKALDQGEIDVGLVFATDGRIAAFDFRVLRDDKNFFPNYAITPVVRKDVLDEHPKLRTLLNKMGASLDDSTMQRLNKMVDVQKKTVENVAEMYLKEQDLI